MGTAVLLVFQRTTGLSEFSYSLKLTLLSVLLAWGSAGLQLWSSRTRFAMQAVALALIVFDQALFSLLAYLTGGLASAATSLLGVTCLVGGLLLGVPGALAAGVSGFVFFSLIFLITQGAPALLPPDQPRQLYQLGGAQTAYYYVFTVLMLLLVGLLAGMLADRLQRAGGAVEDARRRAERAERMAGLGRLAAGLAHEIRNPLGSISGAVQMLRSEMDKEEDRELCDIVLREANRLNELVSDMTNLSKQREPDRSVLDIGRVVDDVVELAGASGRGAGDVHVRRQGAKQLFISADAAQMRQLVWNLVRNAVQASAAGGEVRVRLESAKTVSLVIEDDGVGIDSSSREQLFDAFFSTRSQGTGLGLAVVKQIADEHQFSLEVHSEHGQGAQFVVNFGPEQKRPES